jgi:predicted nucleotide-binding protein (sugar kinase/HSP70/actin superfamily)
MKITFPYMGPVFAYRKLFERLGHEVIMPPRPTQKTIELGIKYSPEFICFPFKIILGSYLEAVESGAEAIVTTGFIGACRAVYYGDLSEKILHQLGSNVKVMVFDSPSEDLPGFLRQCRELGNRTHLAEAINILNLVIRLIYAHDYYQKKINHLRPYEQVPGICNRRWLEIQHLLDSCNSLKELREVSKEAGRIIACIPVDRDREVLKVGMVGEIYLVMESFANNDLEDKLAKLGVEVVRNQYISNWVSHSIFPPRHLLRDTDRYLKLSVGGHEKENIGWILKFKKMEFDGIIHLLPFGCMPELVTQTIIPALSADLNLPILSLSLDEQTGWANNMIRLEAFVELLWTRYELLKGGNIQGEVVFRN